MPTVRTGLRRYAGPFGPAQAALLLRRTGAGATPAAVEAAVEKGLEESVDGLLNPADHTDAARWLEMGHRLGELQDIEPLKAWWMARMVASRDPLRERLTLMWHDHFATAYPKIRSARLMLRQHLFLHRHALGSFADLLHGIVRDPAMIVWLDGNTNRVGRANENLARELLELFSLGVGSFSEEDIRESARAFTGWHVHGEEFVINVRVHDGGEKSVLGARGPLQGSDVVDVILRQERCAEFVARRLWRTFVSEEESEGGCAALADVFRGDHLSIAAALAELLRSDAFFIGAVRPSLVKPPALFVALAMRELGAQHVDSEELSRRSTAMGQELFHPPTVRGWVGGRAWLNPTAMLARLRFAMDTVESDRLARGPLHDVSGADPAAVLRTLFCARDVPQLAQNLGHVAASRGSAEQTRRTLWTIALASPPYQVF